MKRYILLGLITLITFHSFGQGNYKVKPSGSKGEFIIPPDSYWGYRENGKKKCGYDQYYYVLFYGLTKDYLKTISELYYTEYWSGNIDYFAKTKLPKHKNNLLNRKIKEQNAQLINLSSFKSTSSGKPFQCSPLDDKNSVYFIQIDYNSLLTGSREQIVSNFSQLAKDLLNEISGKEGTYTWPTSISQNLVEKVFELIPIPQESSLARYGLRQDASFSLLPLNPKIHLRVDHSTLYDSRTSDDVTNTHLYLDYLKALLDTNDIDHEKTSPIVQVPLERDKIESVLQSTSWRFQFTGQSIISYTKFQDNNGDVFFKFDPFISSDFSRTGVTNNFPDASRRLLSSSIDLEFTQDISKSNYLFLFQKYQRGTNSNSSSPGAIGRCCRTNPLRCNSLIFYRDDLALMNSNFSDCDEITDYAIFGERSPIVPLILIEINSNKLFIPFGYTVFDLISNGYIKAAFRLKREFSGTTTTLKNPTLKTILLPGDVIKSK